MLNVHQSTFSRLAAGIVRTRTGRYTEVYPLVVRPCRDGHVSLGVVTDVEFDRLLIAIGRPELAADDRFRDAAARWEHCDELDAVLHEFLAARTTDEVVAELLARGVAVAAVDGAQAVLANPQLAARGFWDELPARLGTARAPGNPVPAAITASTTSTGTGAPSRLAAARDPALPLAGVVVLDLTAFWAGPSATRILADLGARVIWVERPHSRRNPPADATETEVVMHHFHLKMNRNKESVVLDLTTAEGRAAVARLTAEADVLVENFRPGVLDRMGLGPAELCARHPGLVVVSLSGFGSTGPWADRRSYGPTIEAASSIEGRTGHIDHEPMRLGHTLPDGVGGLVGALAALRGLRERAEHGHGGWFDLSQMEAYVALSGEELLDASETGEELARVGNRSRTGARQGVFPCRGDDRWIAIRLADAEDVTRLASVAGAPDVRAAQPTLDEQEARLGDWTLDHDAHDLARRLQAAGIEAFPVLTPPELLADAHLRARGFFVDVPLGDRVVQLPGSPLHGLVHARGAAPEFGAHTERVLAELGR
jgi:crotonobetainyl-CoA:carnitine CoA-transferase CaiB-like acyl-CoA transferase